MRRRLAVAHLVITFSLIAIDAMVVARKRPSTGQAELDHHVLPATEEVRIGRTSPSILRRPNPWECEGHIDARPMKLAALAIRTTSMPE